jgi:hypothetical protein
VHVTRRTTYRACWGSRRTRCSQILRCGPANPRAQHTLGPSSAHRRSPRTQCAQMPVSPPPCTPPTGGNHNDDIAQRGPHERASERMSPRSKRARHRHKETERPAAAGAGGTHRLLARLAHTHSECHSKQLSRRLLRRRWASVVAVRRRAAAVVVVVAHAARRQSTP